MEITQIHIPDIPAFKSIFKADVSSSVWQSITDFFDKYWAWIVGLIIVGIVLNAVFSKSKKEEDPTPQDN